MTRRARAATHPSGVRVALAALDAVVHEPGPAGSRTLPFTDPLRLPGDTPAVETVLAPGERITTVTLSPPGAVTTAPIAFEYFVPK